jgi:hypothetical protein
VDQPQIQYIEHQKAARTHKIKERKRGTDAEKENGKVGLSD